MSRLVDAIREIWCALRGRTNPLDKVETPTVLWLREREREAIRGTREIRLRRNFMEEELVRRRREASQ